MDSTFSRLCIDRVWSSILLYGRQPCSWPAEQENYFFPCLPRSRLRIWSRETVSAVPSRVVSLLVLYTQAESSAYSWASHLPPDFRGGVHQCHQPPSGQSQVYQATTMRTDVVHCRESVGTGPAVLKVVPVTGAAFSSRVTWLLLFFYISCPRTPPIRYQYYYRCVNRGGAKYLRYDFTRIGIDSTPYSSSLENYWPRAGGLSAVNTIETQQSDLMNSGLARSRLTVCMYVCID